MAYVLRFCNNLKKNRIDPKKGKLEVAKLYEAEKVILKEIQLETLAEEKQIKLNTMKRDDGLIRVETRVSCRKDLETFRYPILLPNTHQLVKKLIMEKHIELEHAGTQTLMSNLRESYWIIKSRKTIRQVENKKCWIVLFTWAIYRAVHLELITSLSTDSFILAFRRFIARRGRPTTIYSDNGKNFVGTFNALNSIDWDKIQDFALKIKIQWKFSPSSAPWWGGFWERLVGMLKNVLRKVLGKASLNKEELNTLLCDAESIINSRPITYLSEDPKDLVALTPAMFLQEIREIGVPDFDMIDSKKLERRFIYRVKIRKDFRRNRFRNEYLGLLKDYSKVRKEASVKDGDIVLIGDNDVKRINWPMAKIIKSFPGKDGRIRVVEYRFSLNLEVKFNSNRAPKCLKCSGGHLTAECKKSTKSPAKCANCGGPHPANFSGCPSNPVNRKQQKNKPNNNIWTEKAKARAQKATPHQQQPKTYASAVA
ncbi:integrase catalytic domain-containing protein [Trichonephila clavipes]|nr:integrase catalytic domain-containing protein [Trichonephila clavipes]